MLRQRVCDLMIRVHRISPELAAYHVREMPPGEVRQRFLMYVRDRIGGAELSAEGPKTEPVNVSSTRFSRPATMTAGPRHSSLFPQSGTSSARFGSRKPGKAGAIDSHGNARRKGGPDEASGGWF
jgi:hypothetical protein